MDDSTFLVDLLQLVEQPTFDRPLDNTWLGMEPPAPGVNDPLLGSALPTSLRIELPTTPTTSSSMMDDDSAISSPSHTAMSGTPNSITPMSSASSLPPLDALDLEPSHAALAAVRNGSTGSLLSSCSSTGSLKRKLSELRVDAEAAGRVATLAQQQRTKRRSTASSERIINVKGHLISRSTPRELIDQLLKSPDLTDEERRELANKSSNRRRAATFRGRQRAKIELLEAQVYEHRRSVGVLLERRASLQQEHLQLHEEVQRLKLVLANSVLAQTASRSNSPRAL